MVAVPHAVVGMPTSILPGAGAQLCRLSAARGRGTPFATKTLPNARKMQQHPARPSARCRGARTPASAAIADRACGAWRCRGLARVLLLRRACSAKSSVVVRQYVICAAVVLCWISAATLVFSLNEWRWADRAVIFVTPSTRACRSALARWRRTRRRAREAVHDLHVLLGASAVGGCAAGASRRARASLRAGPSRMALLGAFEAADADRSGSLSRAELLAVLDGVGLKLDAAEADALSSPLTPAATVWSPPKSFWRRSRRTSGRVAGAADAPRVAVTTERGSAQDALARSRRRAVGQSHARAVGAVDRARCGVGVHRLACGTPSRRSILRSAASRRAGCERTPSLGADGTLPRSSALFVALYCLSGIPIFAMALGQFASVFVQRILAARSGRRSSRISPKNTLRRAHLLGGRTFGLVGVYGLGNALASARSRWEPSSPSPGIRPPRRRGTAR